MEKVSSFVGFLMSTVVLATSLRRIAEAAHMDSDLPTHVPSKLDEIPVVLPKSWPTVNPTYVPENISAEVVEGSKEVVKRLKAATGYLWPKRKVAHDFHNFDRRQAGFATTNYCEYEGRFVRKGTQKYIPEFDKVVVCRSVNPLWISVYFCTVLLKTPERYKDMTPRLLNTCTQLCEKKPGASTKSPVGLPEWQRRMNNASERMKTGVYTTTTNRFYRRLKPLTPAVTKRRGRTEATPTEWDGQWDPKWNELKSRPVTMRREEAALRAAGLWFTSADEPSASSATMDEIQALLHKINKASSHALPAKEEVVAAAACTAAVGSTNTEALTETHVTEGMVPEAGEDGELFPKVLPPERTTPEVDEDGELLPKMAGKKEQTKDHESDTSMGDYPEQLQEKQPLHDVSGGVMDTDIWGQEEETWGQQDGAVDEGNDDDDGDPYE